jgi:glycosyltransferase involved in cell wall biosynthesis
MNDTINKIESKFIVALIGARRDYDVAKILYQNNLLDHLFVDAYFNTDSILANLPFIGSSILNRFKKYNAGFNYNLVSPDVMGAVALRVFLKHGSKTTAYKLANKRLGARLINYANGRMPGSFYGFDASSLEFFEWSKGKGWKLFLEQCVAPRSTQISMFKFFEEKYGINYKNQIEHCLFQQARERKEWEYADKVIVPSSYVKSAMLADGNISEHKLHEVNFGFTNPVDSKSILQNLDVKFSSAKNDDKIIRVLFAGNGGYRKGIADLLALAKRFQKEKIQFIIAGQMEKEAMELLSIYNLNNVVYAGKLSKADINEQYKKADIFFFPSYLEGSAMVVLEAMSWGLPIITTHQSGSVAENGISGFICNAGDEEQLFTNLSSLVFNDEFRFTISRQALKRSGSFTEESYGRNLLKVIA